MIMKIFEKYKNKNHKSKRTRGTFNQIDSSDKKCHFSQIIFLKNRNFIQLNFEKKLIHHTKLVEIKRIFKKVSK